MPRAYSNSDLPPRLTAYLKSRLPRRFVAWWQGHPAIREARDLWSLHPDATYFLSRGGDEIPPPIYASLALTNKCNLRCEICGSQKYLDQVGIVRRHMPIDRFEAVAATLFPFLAEVELNSQGDPLLYPHIETVVRRINEHACDLKVQTNGTLFTDRLIEVLQGASGIVMLSLDAVGSRFDEVRAGGVWAKAEPNLLKFLRSRDPRRMVVGLYPTVTRRTLQDVTHVVQFAADNDVEKVEFHRYSPIERSFEEEPTSDELERAKGQLQAWLTKNGNCVKIEFEGLDLNHSAKEYRRKQVASPTKHRIRALIEGTGGTTYPMDPDVKHASPTKICSSPDRYVEIGIDGQISPCCRAQDVALGYATSVEEFADVWFGKNYEKIRRSLDRGARGPLSLPNCEPCLRFFAGKEAAKGRDALKDRSDDSHPDALDPNSINVWRVDMIQKRDGYGYGFRLPLRIDPDLYGLWEDEKSLGPADSPALEVFKIGNGKYIIRGRELLFSSSDNSDARRNGRSYSLRRKSKPTPLAMTASFE
jgi:MoaA/NifB/PqqE/SkfB family radical SAM enzyme